MKTEVIEIQNLHCMGCVRNVEIALTQIEGVVSAKADIEEASVTVNYSGGEEMHQKIIDTLAEYGYPAVTVMS